MSVHGVVYERREYAMSARVHERRECAVIIIMYIYHALINALSAHIVHINLNMIFYTHVEHSPTKNSLHKVLYRNTHTHTHTHTHRVTH